MASQSDEISDDKNGNNSDIDPIGVAIDAGATLSKPASSSIARKRKIHVNEGKYKQRESGTSTSSSGKGNATCAWDRMKGYPKQHFAVVSGSLRCNACSETLFMEASVAWWLGRCTCKPEVPGSSPPPCHWMDLSSVAPNSTPARFVNSQLVCLLPVGVFNEFLFIYDIC